MTACYSHSVPAIGLLADWILPVAHGSCLQRWLMLPLLATWPLSDYATSQIEGSLVAYSKQYRVLSREERVVQCKGSSSLVLSQQAARQCGSRVCKLWLLQLNLV